MGTLTTSYQYDALSRRIAKFTGITPSSAATLYLYDAWNSIAEYSKTAGTVPVFALAKTLLWGTDLSGKMQNAGGVGGLLAINTGNVRHYPTYDGNGNVSEYLTRTGTIAAHFEYDPFGNTVVNTDTGNLFTYRFSTKPRDIETGLYYYGYRYYDPMTGRWPSRDPIEEEGGINLYGFVGNVGVYSVDLLGLFREEATTAIGLTVARTTGGIAMRGTPQGIAALVGISLGLLAGNASAPLVIPEPNDIPSSDSETEREAAKERGKERQDYKKFEQQNKPTETGNEEEDLCADLKHSEEVLRKRQDFGKKWFNDGDHDSTNNSWKNRIEKLKNKLKEKGICCDEKK